MAKKRNVVREDGSIRVYKNDMVKYIAERTPATQPIVRQVLDTMTDYISMMLLHPDCPTNVKFTMGELGKFELKGRAGRKAGEYKNIDGSISIVEEDEPSHQRLAFSVATKFDTELKKASRQRAVKQGWYAYDGRTIYYDEE